jgi:ATP-dependent DNA helicase RecG
MKKENQNTEWKESWRDEYLKWICGFANAQGGVLVIGKNDRGQPVGVSDTWELLETLPNKIRDLLGIVADVNLLKYLKAIISYRGIQRVETYPVPRAALREAMLNAIIHKDYGSGAPIQIRVYDHKITVGNASVLPEDWSVQDLTQEHESRPFNPDIAHVFFRAGQIETWGRGIEKIFDACAAAGLPEPRYGDTGATLRLTFPFKDLAPNLPSDGTINDTINGTIKLSQLEQNLLILLSNQPTLTIPELVSQLNKSERTIKRSLKNLQINERLKRIGSRKTGHWEVLK